MSDLIRVEDTERVSLITNRTRNSELWFVNNERLHERIIAKLAKCQHDYGVILYAAVIQGNHFHIVARFPKANRAAFMRDWEVGIQQLLKYTTDYYPGGSLWARPYAEQALPLEKDIEDKFFYCALQAVKSGLCARISDYPGYNSFHDSSSSINREYELVDWTAYHEALRTDPEAAVKDFVRTYTLKLERLPGYRSLTKKEYKRVMLGKLEERRLKLLATRIEEGEGEFPPLEFLYKTKPGTIPFKTKTSTRKSHRPLVLTSCAETRKAFLDAFFYITALYKEASKRYRAGDMTVEFPPGTYKPAVCYNCH